MDNPLFAIAMSTLILDFFQARLTYYSDRLLGCG